LDIQIISDLPGTTHTGLLDEALRLGDMFMLVYSVTSRASFDSISRYQRLIHRRVDISLLPIMVVGNHGDQVEERQVSWAAGYEYAISQRSAFSEVNKNDSKDLIQKTFFDLVRLRWIADQALSDQTLSDLNKETLRPCSAKVDSRPSAFKS